VINRAGSGKEHIIVERDGLPVIAMISMAEYDQLMREHEERRERQRRIERFTEAARAFGKEAEERGITEEQLLEDLDKTREKLFREKYGDAFHS
jgi:PHD/YefM family antitoxin component YafN of YafNO toxin-antitoxin module